MNVTLFTSPTYRPLNINGEILPGAELTFLATGTTDEENVYADADLNTALSNPVVADASGEFVPIYMDPDVIYRAQLRDEEGTLLWDIDPLTPPRDWPGGTIVMFYGTEMERDAAYPPALWAVCNGENGTPDLRDRFPIGVSSTLSVGDTGGAAQDTSSSAGSHEHTGNTGNTALDAMQMPAHSHSVYASTANDTGNVNNRGFGGSNERGFAALITGPFSLIDENGNEDQLIGNTGEAEPEAHNHTISSDGSHTHTVDTLPPYVAVYFLMRKKS